MYTHQIKIFFFFWDFPGLPLVKTQCYGGPVQSLVRELRPCKPCGVAYRILRKEERNTSFLRGIQSIQLVSQNIVLT